MKKILICLLLHYFPLYFIILYMFPSEIKRFALAAMLLCVQFAVQAMQVHGISGPLPGEFTFQQYLPLYLEHSPDFQFQKNTLKKAKNTYQNAFIQAFLPSMSADAAASKTYTRYNSLSSWEELHQADSSASAQANWNFINGGKDFLAYKSARIAWQKAQIEFDQKIQELALEAARTYFTLLGAQRLLEVYQNDLEIVEKQYQKDKQYYDHGLKTWSDVLSSETNWRSGQLTFFTAQNNYQNALTDFNLSLSRAQNAPVKLQQEETSFLTPASLEQSLQEALENRHDVRLQRLTLQQEDIALLQAKLAVLPTFYAGAFADTSRRLNHHELWGYNYGLNAGIRFDLGFFYLDKYRTRQNAVLDHTNAYWRFEQFLRTIRKHVTQSQNALQLQLKSVEISRLRMQAAEQKFESMQKKYQNGLCSATDLTVNRQEMVSAQVSHATLLTDVILTQLNYQYELGRSIYSPSEDLLK